MPSSTLPAPHPPVVCVSNLQVIPSDDSIDWHLVLIECKGQTDITSFLGNWPALKGILIEKYKSADAATVADGFVAKTAQFEMNGKLRMGKLPHDVDCGKCQPAISSPPTIRREPNRQS